MIGQSKIGSNSQVIFITLFFSGRFYALLRLLPASAKVCKTGWSKPICRASLACFHFSSLKFTVQGQMLILCVQNWLIGFLTYPSGTGTWLFLKFVYHGTVRILRKKYENSYQVVSICTKFTIFTQWYEYHGIEMCDTRGVHSFNMNMLI